MKKGKGKWLPLTLMLAAGSALLPMGCDNGNDPAPTEVTDPIPDLTSITFDGKNVWIDRADYSGDYDAGGYKVKWHNLVMGWRNEYHNKTDKLSIIWGKDYLEDGADSLIVILVGSDDNTTTISKADVGALLAKIQATLPSNSGKTVRDNSQYNSKVTIVEQYAAMIKDAVIRMAQGVKANFARGA